MSRDTQRYRRAMSAWLLGVWALVFAMVVVGGLTRLHQAGLSITEWKPIMGALPPLTHDHWVELFEKYQQSPEYQKINHGMSLGEFEFIFWFEWTHRQLGRLIGLYFAAPFAFFVLRGAVDRSLALRLTGLFTLGGLQGFIGWWMVASGLVDRPDVSHLRLATHLGGAFAIAAAALWIALSLRKGTPDAPAAPLGLRRGVAFIAVAVFVTALSGALVAGLDAGFAFNTFPLMAGELVPSGLLYWEPWHRNVLDNPLTVQFQHRVLALSVAAAVAVLWWRGRSAPVTARARRALHALLGVVLLQVSLGIATLLSVVWLPLASAHQLGAFLLFSTAIWLNHELYRPVGAQSATTRS